MVLGLSILRPQLETLICSQSVTKIEVRIFIFLFFLIKIIINKIKDLISDCGGDSAQPQPWPHLKSLFLDHNFIERIDQSLVRQSLFSLFF